jgi:microcystin degradation protein MlrC
LADGVLDRLARQIWDARTGFVYDSEPLTESLARARQLSEGAAKPLLLLDHSDNCMSGGTCDSMDVLQACLASGMRDILTGPLCDPQAVDELVRAGKGAQVSLQLGNKVSLAGIGLHKQPLTVTGRVRAISDGQYTVTGPIYTGLRCHMGRTVWLDTGAAQVVVCEQTHEPWDLGVFQCVGVDPTRYRYLLLKSRMYCRPVFVPISSGLIECDSPGVTSSDYSHFPFANVRRPVYPIDPMN